MLQSSKPCIRRALKQKRTSSAVLECLPWKDYSGHNSRASEMLTSRFQLLRGFKNTLIFQKTGSFYSKFSI